MSLRETILGFNDKKRVWLSVPEWNGVELYAAAMSATRQVAYAAAKLAYPDAPGAALIVAFGAEDADGALIFEPGDCVALAEKNADAITRVCAAITDQHKSADELRKNS